MKKITRAGLSAGVSALLAATLAACPSGKGSSTGGGESTANADCGYTWDPCASASAHGGTPAPAESTYHSIYDTSTPQPTEEPVRWGDYRFGTCALNLYPANVGLTIKNRYVVLLAGTACVGFQPQELTIHVHLERWYSAFPPGSTSRTPVPAPNWHEVFQPGWPIVDSTLPPLAVIGPNGDIPLALQHKITGVALCAAATHAGEPSLYRLTIDWLGVSYSGEPFVSGGTTAPLIVPASQC